MTTFNTSSPLRLSSEMYTALFKDQDARFLVDSILADNKVLTDSTQGQSDSAALNKLRAHLEAAAKKDDRVLNETELALLNALDAGSRDGASTDVVLRNLQQIQKFQQQVADGDLDPTQIQFEVATQTYAERQLGQAQTHTVTQDPAATALAAGACSIDSASDCQNNSAEQMTREGLISPTRVAQGEAVDQLQHEAGALMERFRDTAAVPDSKLREDLTRLAQALEESPEYVSKVLNTIGLSPEVLQREGIIADANISSPENRQRLKEYLAGDKFKAFLDAPATGPAALSNYRGLLVTTLNNYAQNPSTQNFEQLNQIIYDHSYAFEAAQGVPQEAVDAYKQFKQTLLNVSQQTNLLEKISSPHNLPSSMSDLNSQLQSTQERAQDNILTAARQIDQLLDQIEANPGLYPGVDVNALRSQLAGLVELDSEGQATALNNPPAGQAHLEALNSLWAELEQVGLQAGLGDDFSSSQGALSRALERAQATPEAATDPALEILRAAPELAEHTALLNALSDPKNKALLDAVMSNDPAKVAQFFSEYSTRYFDLSAMLGSFGVGAAIGSVLPGGALLGGLAGAGVSLAQSFTSQNFSLPGLGSLSTYANRFSSFFKPQLAAPSLGLASSLNLPGLGFAAAQTPNGRDMNLLGVSQKETRALMELLAQKPEARALLQQHGANLERLLASQPAAEVRDVIAAKSSFDQSFWSDSSSLEDAQASVQNAMATQTNARISLEQAAIALEQALAGPELNPDVRRVLEVQQNQIADALSSLNSGSVMPEANATLDQTIRAVREANLNSGVTATETVVNQAEQFLIRQKTDPMLNELRASLENGQMDKLLNTLPAAQAAQLREVLKGREDGQLSVEGFAKGLEAALRNSQTNQDSHRLLTEQIETLLGLVRKANEPGATPASLAAYGNTGQNPNSLLPGSRFDILADMQFFRNSRQELSESLGRRGMSESLQALHQQAVSLAKDMPQPINRQELYSRLSQSRDQGINSQLRDAALSALSSAGTAVGASASARPRISAEELSQTISSNPQVQQVLQLVFAGVGDKLNSDPEIKPILEKLAQANSTALSQIQALLGSFKDPAELNKSLSALLSKDLDPASAAKLQRGIMREMDRQLSNQIRAIEQQASSSSRTDTRQAQTNMVKVLQAYRQLLNAEQGRQTSLNDVATTVSRNAGELIDRTGLIGPGLSKESFFHTMIPSAFSNTASPDQVYREMAQFLSISTPEAMSQKLGVEVSREKFMQLRLAISSVAMSLSLNDPNRGPVAVALGALMQQVINHPEAYKSPEQMTKLQEMFALAANVNSPESRDLVMAKIAALSSDAAKSGQDLVAANDLNPELTKPQPVPGREETSQPGGQTPVPEPQPKEKIEVRPILVTLFNAVDGKPGKAADSSGSTPPGTQQDPFSFMDGAVSDAVLDDFWRIGVGALADTSGTYLTIDPYEQDRFKQDVDDFLDEMNRANQTHVENTKTYHSVAARYRQEFKDGVSALANASSSFADLIAKNPGSIDELFSFLADKYRQNLTPLEKAENISGMTDSLAKSMVNTRNSNDKLQEELSTFLYSLRSESYQTQQLALVQLAQRMITESIYAFYDQQTQANNRHHFDALSRMANEFHEKVAQTLQEVLAQQVQDVQTALSSGASTENPDISSVLRESLRTELDSMLATTQQLRPPMMTDFKRHQIVQALFDGDPNNDVRGLLMLAQPASQN